MPRDIRAAFDFDTGDEPRLDEGGKHGGRALRGAQLLGRGGPAEREEVSMERAPFRRARESGMV